MSKDNYNQQKLPPKNNITPFVAGASAGYYANGLANSVKTRNIHLGTAKKLRSMAMDADSKTQYHTNLAAKGGAYNIQLSDEHGNFKGPAPDAEALGHASTANAYASTANDLHGLADHHERMAGATFADKVVGPGKKVASVAGKVAGVAGKMARVFKTDGTEMNTELFANDPLIKFWDITNLQKSDVPQELIKMNSIQGYINVNLEHWATEDGALEAIEYFNGDNGLRKAVYLEMFDKHGIGDVLAKSDDADDSYLSDLAQYCDNELLKAYGDTTPPNTTASSSYGTPTPPAKDKGNPDVGAQQTINPNNGSGGDPALTTRGGQGRLIANYAAAFKQATENPIHINPSSTGNPFQKPTGSDLEGSVSKADGYDGDELTKSIGEHIATRLHAHADSLSEALKGGQAVINDAGRRLHGSSFASRIRNVHPHVNPDPEDS